MPKIIRTKIVETTSEVPGNAEEKEIIAALEKYFKGIVLKVNEEGQYEIFVDDDVRLGIIYKAGNFWNLDDASMGYESIWDDNLFQDSTVEKILAQFLAYFFLNGMS